MKKKFEAKKGKISAVYLPLTANPFLNVISTQK